VSFESHAEAIKLGVLMDWKVPEDHPQELMDDFFLPLELVFRESLEQGLIDRPVELVVRETWGLPKGSVKAVIDAYEELVDEGCLAVYGPGITENCVPTREAIEERFKVPAISMTGTDDWLGGRSCSPKAGTPRWAR
jgi:branched-chain amino acid transport system substrate-binding protein